MTQKLLLFISLMLITFFSMSQKKYLSFAEGEKKVEAQETMPVRNIISSSNIGIELEYKFSGAFISEKEVEKTSYNFIHINGYTPMAEIGKPALPADKEIIALPENGEAQITIIDSEFYEYSGYYMHPALEPARDTEGAGEPEFTIDTELYKTNAFFPEKIVETVEVQKMRGIPLAFVQIRPIQFNPVTKTIRVYTKIRYRIDYIGGNKSFNYAAEQNSLHFTNILKRLVLNKKQIPDGIKRQDRDGKSGKDYIIITHSQFLDAANTLANWKRQLGYSVEVVSQSSWTAAQVKNEIHTRYSSWTPKPDYFVIIGDHNGTYAVPGEEYRAPDDSQDYASDLYYSCMDGTGDYVPDIAKGRISVTTLTDANKIVNKVIDYEKTPINDATYYSTGLNCAQYQDDDNNGYADRRFCHTSENVRDYLINEQGYTVNRVYYTSSGANVTTLRYNNDTYSNGELLSADLRNASFAWDGAAAEIKAEIEAGRFYLLHRDHGYTGGSGWAHPYYTTTSLNSLNNGDKRPVVFSINCHTGEFYQSNCFAEKFMRIDGGAVGVVAAACYSYSGYNDALIGGVFNAMWSDPGLELTFGTGGVSNPPSPPTLNEYHLGDVMNYGLERMMDTWNGSSSAFEYTHRLYHYFGDPAMQIWTANPNNNVITATHSSTINCSNNSFSISGSTAGAIATLVHNNTLISQTTLDGSGNGSLSYSLSASGSVTLTISKHNCKPYVSVLTQVCAGYPPELNTNDATSVTGNSAVLNGEIATDNGETVNESGFVYSTNPDPVIGGAGVTQVQTSPTVTTGAFNKSISGLSGTTTYYYKAYAKNANGTGYGNEKTFETLCGIVSSYPYSENFDNSGNFPDCWTQQSNNCTDRWTVSNTTNAGGSNYEMKFSYEDASPATSRLITVTLNTTGYSQLNLSFKHFLDDYGAGTTLKIQSTTDGTNWTDEAWSLNSGNGSAGPETVNTTISNNLNSSTTQIAFVVTGNLYQIDYWYIDDIEISIPPPMTYSSSNAVQDNTSAIEKGTSDEDILEIQIVTTGAANPLSATSFTFNTNGSYNAANDIDNAKLYYTGTTETFAASNQFGSTTANPDGSFTVSGTQELQEGTNYFWLAYDINALATDNNFVDAECTSLTVGTAKTPTETAPSGRRKIVSDLCLITAFPFTEGFEGTFLPSCWAKNIPGSANDITQSSTQNHTSSGTYSARFSSYSTSDDYNQYLFTPQIEIPVNAELSFWHIKYNTSNELLEWGVSATTTPGAYTWTSVSLSNTSWQQSIIDLSSYEGQTVYIGFHYYGSYLYYVYLDDVSITAPGLWIGDGSNNWTTGTNWGDDNTPTNTVDATIPANCNNYPNITGTSDCKNLTIKNGGEFTVATDGAFTANGDITVGDGTSGTLNLSDGSTTVTGDFTTNAGSNVNITSGTISVSGTVTLDAANTVKYDYNGDRDIYDWGYGKLIISGTGIKNVTGTAASPTPCKDLTVETGATLKLPAGKGFIFN